MAISKTTQSRSGRPIMVELMGSVAYEQGQALMQQHIAQAHDETPDTVWLLEHPAVYTQGTACKQTPHLLSTIPICKSDRGGQITYHGPGQVVLYPMLRLRNYGLTVKQLVHALEQAAINLLQEDYDLIGERRPDAPGVYIQGRKIAQLGLRIRRGRSYHGLSLNVDMDLTPFANIDPCGYAGLEVTQLADLTNLTQPELVPDQLLKHFLALL